MKSLIFINGTQRRMRGFDICIWVLPFLSWTIRNSIVINDHPYCDYQHLPQYKRKWREPNAKIYFKFCKLLYSFTPANFTTFNSKFSEKNYIFSRERHILTQRSTMDRLRGDDFDVDFVIIVAVKKKTIHFWLYVKIEILFIYELIDSFYFVQFYSSGD